MAGRSCPASTRRSLFGRLLNARSEERAEGSAYRNGGTRDAITFEREQQSGNAAGGEKKGS